MEVPFAVETLQNSHGYGHPRMVCAISNGTYRRDFLKMSRRANGCPASVGSGGR